PPPPVRVKLMQCASQKADFLQDVGTRTPAFVRFSTVTYGREFPDEGRNPRGFAIKLYTGEGNYDIVGMNFVSGNPPIHAPPFSPTQAHSDTSSPCSSAATPSRART
ncbi:catalase, partial [Candidatus Bathyarchaeota archaeon]|nr:catalase [Candidatus Bathyarchaeota archaeon]